MKIINMKGEDLIGKPVINAILRTAGKNRLFLIEENEEGEIAIYSLKHGKLTEIYKEKENEF